MLSKKEICQSWPPFAYYSGLGGIELVKIEYGIEDYCWCVSGCWCGKPQPHRLKIRYTEKGDAL